MGEFFRTSLSSTVDSSHYIFNHDTPEVYAHDELIGDNGQTHFRRIVNKRKLIEAGLSVLSFEGIYFAILSLNNFFLIPILSIFYFSWLCF